MEYFCSNCLWHHQSLSEKKSGDDRLESESHQHRIVPKTRSKTITRTTTTSHKYNMVTTWILQGIILLSYFTSSIHAIPLYLTANTPVAEELRHLKPNQTSHPQSPVEKIFSSPPKWHNPCGAPTKNNQNNNNNNPINIPNTMSNDIFGLFNSNVEHPSDSDLMHGIISIAKVALRQSRFFKEDYVKKTFHENSWWDHHERWKDMRYRWLPTWKEIPKHLHESALLSHLEELEMVSSMKSMFTYLQKLAAGMEQVVADQAYNNGQFLTEFDRAQFELKTVLCELEYALIQKGVPVSELDAVPREIVPTEVRHLEDESYRNLRDWYIYRDYMNGLEYVIDAFNHIRANPNSTKNIEKNHSLKSHRRSRRRRRRRHI